MEYDRRRQLGYREFLRRVHEELRPAVYCEIGVHYGHSAVLAQPGTKIVGIDPSPTIEVDLLPDTSIYELTSDDFFENMTIAEVAGAPADLSFIDGRHLFEYALRDFRNVERNSKTGSTILFHDCAPPIEWAEREVRSGDVWRLVAALTEFRPDLTVRTILAPPSGVGLVIGLDPDNTALWDRYDEIVTYCMALSYTDEHGVTRPPVNPVDTADWAAVRAALPAIPYREVTATDRLRARSRRTRLAATRAAKLGMRRVSRRLGRASA